LHVVTDGGERLSITTGPDWIAQRTATVYDDLYGGETYDQRANSREEPVEIVSGPRGLLQWERLQPIRAIERLAPVRIESRGSGEYVVDFGRVIAGRVHLAIQTHGTHEIVLSHGEKLTSEGLPNLADGEHYFPERFQTDRCILDGPGAWHPSFTYHGFRYVHVTGWPAGEPLTPIGFCAEVVRTDLETVGGFRCSDELLNRMHEAAVETVRINLHGIPTDTPTYEKNGWTGDGMLAAEMMLLNLDSELLLLKWLDDISDSRDATGRPQIIAPSPGWGDVYKPSPTWHSDYILTPWSLYWHSGDASVLQRHYDGMKGYVLCELASSRDGIADSVLNDWCSPETEAWGGDAPDDHRVSGTAYLYTMLSTMARIAAVLDRAAQVASAFQGAFFDGARGLYRGEGDLGYRQSHNVLALAFGLVPEHEAPRVVANLVGDVVDRGDHLNTGILGTKYLLPMLSRNGHADLALRIATQTTFPSWGYWFERGATTLWENWREDARSRSHYMFGTFDDWFFQDVLGVRATAPGYRRFSIRPADIELDWAEGELPTGISGSISVSWTRTPRGRTLRARIPHGTVADVELVSGSERKDAVWGAGEHEMEIGR
jgi:alpha-L-rhamnosidase